MSSSILGFIHLLIAAARFGKFSKATQVQVQNPVDFSYLHFLPVVGLLAWFI